MLLSVPESVICNSIRQKLLVANGR